MTWKIQTYRGGDVDYAHCPKTDFSFVDVDFYPFLTQRKGCDDCGGAC